MASSQENPRPPENPVKRRSYENTPCNRFRWPERPASADTSGDFNAASQCNRLFSIELQTNRTKNDCNQSIAANSRMKSENNRETRPSVARRPASLPPVELNSNSGAYRKRGSYHQDVEEALSSLLWQPYEYRTQSDSSDTLSSLSISTGSLSSTSLSTDYKAVVGGGMLQSFTDEFLVNLATAPLPSHHQYGNAADPVLRSSSQMVSNLMVLDGRLVGPPVSQCGRGVRSRGRDGCSTLSQIGAARSRVREPVSKCCSSAVAAEPQRQNSSALVSAYCETADANVKCASSAVIGDDTAVSDSDMRVEIAGAGPDVICAKQLSHAAAYRPPPPPTDNLLLPCNSSVAVEGAAAVDMIPSNMTSVVSANVVGLPVPVPVHTRSSSNLSTAPPQTTRTDIVTSNHPRSVSDSANVFQLQLGTHFRSSSNLANTNTRTINNNNNNNTVPVGIVQHVRASSETVPRNAQPSDDISNNVSVQTRIPPLPNVSNVNVNFYRAVPVNVVSSVPMIQCLNSVEEQAGNNVSNVHIVQAMPATPLPAPMHNVLVQSTPSQQTSVTEVVRTRTFTSTEAQTDDTTVGALVTPTTAVPPSSREQRRRERRERRHQRRLHSSNHQHQAAAIVLQQQQNGQQHHHQIMPAMQPNDRLPDLLNSHLPPPYSTLPGGMPPPVVAGGPLAMVTGPAPGTIVSFPHPGVGPPPVPVPVAVPAPHTGFRFPFPSAAGFRRCRSRLGPRYSTEEHQPKSCCGFLVSRPGSLRWFIALIALVAVCCVLVGTVLGAMRPAGRDHLTVSLLMIGVGIVLVTVSGVAWRLTSHDAPSCRAMLGLSPSDSGDVCTRRFVPRLPPSYGRPHHPYAAMIYPEFQYRPPPPSYQASMQEYRLRLLLLDRGGGNAAANAANAAGVQGTVSPPPTYRSHAGSLLRAPLSNRRDASQSEYSCPPSYRSRTSSNRQQCNDAIVHSREQSLSLSESNHDGSVVNVVNILANQEEEIALDTIGLDSLKVVPDNDIPPLRMLLKSSSGSDLETSKDGNLVTIVQKADQNPVIVTVSGSHMTTTNPEVGSSNQIPSEMEILAHL